MMVGRRFVFLGRLKKWRGEIRMISQILLEGLITHHDSESAARIHIDGSLGIQIVEGDHLLDGFRGTLIEHGEMYLVVDEPVVVDAIHCAVFQIKLH